MHVFAHASVRVRARVRVRVRACIRGFSELRVRCGPSAAQQGCPWVVHGGATQVTLNVMTTYIALLESNKAVRVAPSP